MEHLINSLIEELTIRTSRSSGPGGQNVNKVNSKVDLSFNITQSSLLSEGQKLLIKNVYKSRISQEGVLTLSAQQSRSQNQNRIEAINRFRKMISSALTPKKKRLKTKPSRASRLRRLENKKHNSDKKNRRRIIP